MCETGNFVKTWIDNRYMLIDVYYTSLDGLLPRHVDGWMNKHLYIEGKLD